MIRRDSIGPTLHNTGYFWESWEECISLLTPLPVRVRTATNEFCIKSEKRPRTHPLSIIKQFFKHWTSFWGKPILTAREEVYMIFFIPSITSGRMHKSSVQFLMRETHDCAWHFSCSSAVRLLQGHCSIIGWQLAIRRLGLHCSHALQQICTFFGQTYWSCSTVMGIIQLHWLVHCDQVPWRSVTIMNISSSLSQVDCLRCALRASTRQRQDANVTRDLGHSPTTFVTVSF